MKSILIVEDDSFMSAIYREKFSSVGFDAVVAPDPAKAVAELSRRKPDVVLLDLMLGEVSGVELLKYIRAQPAMATMPVVVMANTYMGGLIDEARKSGATKCLNKAIFSPTLLVDEIRGAIDDSQKPAASAMPMLAAPLKIVSPNAPAAPRPAAVTDPEEARANLQRELLQSVSQRLEELPRLLKSWVDHAHVPHAPYLGALVRSVHSLAASAALVGCARLAQVGSALEALLLEIKANPKKVTPSSLHTVTQAIEFVPMLFTNHTSPQDETFASPLILVVDDEPISRRTLCAALKKVQLRALSVSDPAHALPLFQENQWDLVFLDVEMPGFNGFEVCEKLHATDLNNGTPVVFVTGLDDPETRSHSTKNRAVDFITKPVIPTELAVKAIVHLHRGRIATQVPVTA